MSPRWGYHNVALLGLPKCCPAGATKMPTRGGSFAVFFKPAKASMAVILVKQTIRFCIAPSGRHFLIHKIQTDISHHTQP